jgi:DNA-binding XRE family transcriptional regulator
MSKTKIIHKNHLTHYRRRMRFTQKEVLHLMGPAERSKLWRLEMGESLPTLLTVLKLSAILRAPVEFLYHDIYVSLREDIRKREEHLPVGQQGVLPIFTP